MKADQEHRHLRGLANLAAAVAHKMNNDLAGVTCNLSLLLNDFADGSPPDDAEDLIQDALQAAQHASHLLQSAFGLFRMDSDECEPLDVQDVIEPVCQSTAEQSGIRVDLRFELPSEPLAVRSTTERMQRMIAPLLINAAEAACTPPATATVSASERDPADAQTVDDLSPGPYVVVVVRDEGPGFDPANRGKLFDAFFSTKERGRGLGLSLTLALARSHGGSVELRDPEGGGAEVRIWLPRP